MRKNIWLLLISLLVCQISLSQKYSFQTYSTEEGLPQTQVTDIVEDKDGYLWVGTYGGLGKFNGKNFVTYSSYDGLLKNRVLKLEYLDDALWVSHDGGISIIKNNEIETISFPQEQSSYGASSILKFKNEIYITTHGGGIYMVKDGELIDYTYDHHDETRDWRIRGAAVSGDSLYLATRHGVFSTADMKTFSRHKGFGTKTYSDVISFGDTLFFTTYWDLFQYIPKEKEVKWIDSDELKGIDIKGCEKGQNGNLWLIVSNGVISMGSNGSSRFLDESSGLPFSSLKCVYEDREGNFWIGSNARGMFRVPGERFKYFDRSTDYLSDLFLTGFENEQGDFYFGTFDEGILKKPKNKDMEVVFSDKKCIWSSVHDVGGRDWFATITSLVSFDNNGDIEIHKVFGDYESAKIAGLYRVGPNEMYIGGGRGVVHYKNGEFDFLNEKESNKLKSIGTVRDFIMIDEGLVCASHLGLFLYKDGSFSKFKDVKDYVSSIEKDKYGNIWFGSTEGLFRIKNGLTERFDLLRSPSANNINFLNVRGGELFIGTNNGLFIFSDLNASSPTQKRYGRDDGVVDLETNICSGFFDQKGNFWFGTSSGLMCYYRDIEDAKDYAPKIYLKGLLMNYEPFDYELYSDSLNERGFPVYMTFPNSKNNLIFELDAVSMRNHKGLRYQFFLEGLNQGWSPLTENSTITFTNLSAGQYKLRMRVVDIDGRYSEEIVYPFTINEAFYKTWWFLLLCGLAVIGLFLLYFRLRLRRLNDANEKERLEYKTRLLSLEQQSMNASMNRHFVFNSLNSIQYFINTQDRLSANKYLTNFAKLIRKNLDSATANGNVISLEEELERLRLYLSLESMRFKDRFDYSIEVEKGIDTESIQIPAMMMQPFVENSIIHGILPNEEKKGQINIKISWENEQLIVSVQDNGIGVDQSMSRKPDMEGDHRSKGMEITSKRVELIQKISNENISLEGPFELRDENGSVNGTCVLLKIPLKDLDN